MTHIKYVRIFKINTYNYILHWTKFVGFTVLSAYRDRTCKPFSNSQIIYQNSLSLYILVPNRSNKRCIAAEQLN